MVVHMTRSQLNIPFGLSTTCQPLSSEQSQEKDVLKEKIKSLQQRMGIVRTETERIQSEQETMDQMVSSIQKNHHTMELNSDEIEQQLEHMQQNDSFIKDQQRQMGLNSSFLNSKAKEMSSKAIGIQGDFQDISLHIDQVDQMHDEIYQTGELIRNQEEWIRRDLQDAAEAEASIQQKANSIQQNHQVMQVTADNIVMNRDFIRDNLHLISQGKGEGVDLSREDIHEKGAVVSFLISRFWSAINGTIQVSSWVLKNFVLTLAKVKMIVKDWFSDYQWSVITRVMTNPLSWIAIIITVGLAIKKPFV